MPRVVLGGDADPVRPRVLLFVANKRMSASHRGGQRVLQAQNSVRRVGSGGGGVGADGQAVVVSADSVSPRVQLVDKPVQSDGKS